MPIPAIMHRIIGCAADFRRVGPGEQISACHSMSFSVIRSRPDPDRATGSLPQQTKGAPKAERLWHFQAVNSAGGPAKNHSE
jgi:hypothetical protein